MSHFWRLHADRIDNLILSAESTDDEGIVQVEFFNGDEKEPFSVHTWTSPRKVRNTTSVPTTLPLTAGPVDMRVRAYDEGGRWRETSVTIDVMDAVELDAAGGNNWSALEDQFVYLKSGELLIDEPRTVAGLMVLNGALISHSECEPGNETRLDLTVTGPLYVGCGALIDVSGKGYGGGKTFEGEVPSAPQGTQEVISERVITSRTPPVQLGRPTVVCTDLSSAERAARWAIREPEASAGEG